MSIQADKLKSFLQANVDALQQGLRFIHDLQSGQYTQECKPAFESTIGAHFRHILEHYHCFFAQLPSGLIRYDQRARQTSVEQDAALAATMLEEICDRLMQADYTAVPSTLKVQDQDTLEPVSSSLERELLFLQAHSVHHFAIIAALGRSMGMELEQGFGVAISTRIHQAEMFASSVNQ